DRNLRTRWCRDKHALERVEVFAKISRVSRIDRITLASFDCSRDILSADGRFNDVVYIANFQSVTRSRFAIHSKIQEITANRALGECAARIREFGQFFFDLHRELLDLAKIGTKNFYAEHAAKSGGEHFGARLDWHPEDVRHAGRLNIRVDFGKQLFPSHSAPPLVGRL